MGVTPTDYQAWLVAARDILGSGADIRRDPAPKTPVALRQYRAAWHTNALSAGETTQSRVAYTRPPWPPHRLLRFAS